MFASLIPAGARALRAVRSQSGLALVFLSLVSIRCSSPTAGGERSSGDGGGIVGSEPDNSSVANDPSMGGADGVEIPLNPLCGVGVCVPDRKTSCTEMGGAGGEAGTALGGEAGGLVYDPGDLGVQGESCQVRREAGCVGEDCQLERTCAPSGASSGGDPCVSQADCGAGLACVGEGRSGICRPYCCQGTARSCAAGTFCDEAPFPEAPDMYVPVCLPVDDCALTDPYPCPQGQDCSCPEELACVVVRPDGDTACTVPGAGREGDACTGTQTAECAHGYVCHPNAGCRKLCSLVVSPDSDEPECPRGGICQPPSEFPSDLGICVGATEGTVAAR